MSKEEKHQEYIEFVNKVFDKAKTNLKLETDKELGDWLGEHKMNISRYRSGQRTISDWLLIKVCQEAGYTMADALNMILRYKSFKEEIKSVILDIAEMVKGK